jgi:hypothetical protein
MKDFKEANLYPQEHQHSDGRILLNRSAAKELRDVLTKLLGDLGQQPPDRKALSGSIGTYSSDGEGYRLLIEIVDGKIQEDPFYVDPF